MLGAGFTKVVESRQARRLFWARRWRVISYIPIPYGTD